MVKVKNGEFFMIKEMQAKGIYLTHIANELGRDPKPDSTEGKGS
ncbi:hypothetical protein J2T13_002900 [Paenibacillus sp. DS2015]